MSKPASDLRLFVAAYPSHESARAMAKAVERMELPPHKLTPREQIHLTLQFIGDVPQRDFDDTIESVQRAAVGLGKFTLAPQRLITLPERGPARLIAAQTDAPATLLELQRRLAIRLARNIREKDDRPFRPHLTLCRFRSPVRGVVIDQSLAADAFEVSKILLMGSVLLPDGARHEEVMACELGPRD